MTDLSFAEAERTDATAWYTLAAASPEAAGVGVEWLAGGVVLTRPAIDAPFWNQAQSFDHTLSRDDVEAVLGHFRERGVRHATLKTTPVSAGDDWDAIAASAGLTRIGGFLKWVAPADDAVKAVDGSRTDLRVARVERPDARRWSATMWEIFGLVDEAAVDGLAAILDQPEWHGYAAWDGDEIAGVGLLYIRGRVAQLFSGATTERYRGRGVQSALIAARIRAARQVGATWITTETEGEELNTSARNVVRAGFTNVYAKTLWGWG